MRPATTMNDKRPSYKTYRARRRPWDRFRRTRFDDLERLPDPEPGDPHFPAPPPSPTRGDAGMQPTPPPRERPRPVDSPRRAPKPPPRIRRPRTKVPWRRVIKWFIAWAVLWVVLSGVLFVVSATIQQSKISDATNAALGGGGNLLTAPGNVLVMGLDERPKNWKVARAPARTDTLIVLRTGGGQSKRLSIPRDSYAQIPGYQAQKINAAYALGGAALAIRTVEDFLNAGVATMSVNHMTIVDFERFPGLIDAMGGVTVEVKQRCIRSTFDGKTFKLRRGKHRLNGKQALRFARVRKNECNPAESDLARAERQQQVMNAMKHSVFNPLTFVRLPWIAWAAPKAFVTDMSPFTFMNFTLSSLFGKSPKSGVLKPSGPGPGSSLIIPESERVSWARRLSE